MRRIRCFERVCLTAVLLALGACGSEGSSPAPITSPPGAGAPSAPPVSAPAEVPPSSPEEHTLEPGFGSLGLGGSSHMGPACEHVASARRSYVLHVPSALSAVRFSAHSTSATTLAVRAPDGTVRCAVGPFGGEAMIEGPLGAGDHDVFVGAPRPESGDFHGLTITELPAS